MDMSLSTGEEVKLTGGGGRASLSNNFTAEDLEMHQQQIKDPKGQLAPGFNEQHSTCTSIGLKHSEDNIEIVIVGGSAVGSTVHTSTDKSTHGDRSSKPVQSFRRRSHNSRTCGVTNFHISMVLGMIGFFLFWATILLRIYLPEEYFGESSKDKTRNHSIQNSNFFVTTEPTREDAPSDVD